MKVYVSFDNLYISIEVESNPVLESYKIISSKNENLVFFVVENEQQFHEMNEQFHKQNNRIYERSGQYFKCQRKYYSNDELCNERVEQLSNSFINMMNDVDDESYTLYKYTS